jgi:hypothetical protein
MIIDGGRTPVVVTRLNSSRSASVNMTGRFFCQPMTTVLSGRGGETHRTPPSQPNTPGDGVGLWPAARCEVRGVWPDRSGHPSLGDNRFQISVRRPRSHQDPLAAAHQQRQLLQRGPVRDLKYRPDFPDRLADASLIRGAYPPRRGRQPADHSACRVITGGDPVTGP